ncbi:site-specific integrase [Gracilimonas sediminicola]|uniref:Site-specific integrase n=1 Tax=Gracilimonas sediminicola TaxID=2952158 RepID=A0A9X2RFT4_9BACT|nr:site-specific integrase [Gracilimonas sediminicola]MCP9290534.1 site-specific integrase [Gracilimonas sediminicola]
MASLKVLLRTNKQKKDGTSPLVLRITHNRKSRYIYLGQYLEEKYWDFDNQRVKKSHPNSKRLNNLILKKLSEANDTVLELETKDDPVSVKQIKNKVKNSNADISFFDLGEKRIKEYEDKGTFSVARADQSILNNVEKFNGGKDLYFHEITVSFLERFKTYCLTELKHKKRTATNQLMLIRTLYNRAIKEGIVDEKNYPFGGDNVSIKLSSGNKIGLTEEEIRTIEEMEFEKDTSIWHTKNIWLFSFYFAGVRISDVLSLRWSDIKNDRLYYEMSKNEKPVSLKIPDKAIEILEAYKPDKQSKNDYVFPYLKEADQDDEEDIFRKSRNAARLFNKWLKRIAEQAEIDKNLSNHISRHSFGNIAGEKIHPLMLQKLYRHSNLKTTINYQANFINKEADDALDKVIDF